MNSAQFYSNLSRFNFPTPDSIPKKVDLKTPSHIKLSKRLTKSSSKNKSKIFFDFTLKNLGKRIESLTISPCSTYIASSSHGLKISLWSIQEKSKIFTFIGHTEKVYSVNFSSDGKWLVSGSKDKSIKIWNLNKKCEEYSLYGHSSDVFSVIFSSDRKFIASGSYDTTVKLWDFLQRTEVFTFTGHFKSVYSVNFTPDCRYLVTGSHDNSVKVWDIAEKKQKFIVENELYYFISIEVSKSGKFIAYVSQKRNINIWNLEKMCKEYDFEASITVDLISFTQKDKLVISYRKNTGSKFEIFDLNTRNLKEMKYFKYGQRISAFKISPDSSYVAIGFTNGKLGIMNYNIKREKYKLDEAEGRILCIAYSHDGNYLATGLRTNIINIWTIKKNKEKFKLKGHASEITGLLFLKDTNFIISSSRDTTIKIWNIKTKNQHFTLKGHSKMVRSISTSDKFIISGSDDTTIKIWDLTTLSEINSLELHLSVVTTVEISPDSEYLASASVNQKVSIWNIKRNCEELNYYIGNFYVLTLKFTFDCKFLLIATTENKILFFNMKDRVFDSEELRIFISSYSLSNDNKFIGISSTMKGLSIWNLHNKCMDYIGETLRLSYKIPICFTQNLKYFAFIANESSVEIRDFQKSREIGSINRLAKYLYPIRFSKNGVHAAYGHEKKISIWIVQELKEKVTFKAHLYWVRDIDFSPDSQFIVSGGDDNFVKVWDLNGNELIRFIGHSDWVLKVRFSHNGNNIVSASYDYILKVWSVNDKHEEFCFDQLDDIANSIAFKGKYIIIQHKFLYLKVLKKIKDF